METIMNNFIDIHNHSLPGVDDGATDLNEALNNLKILKEVGFNEVVLTSHYILDSKYEVNVKNRLKMFKVLEKNLKKEGIKVYLGNEVYINDAKVLLDLLDKKEITTLNRSKYLLVELPFNIRINGLEQIVCELNSRGITPIIAHPERYLYLKNNFDYLKTILEYDCYLQANLGSLIDKYGKTSRKFLLKLLQNNMITFIATDTHHLKDDKEVKKALKVLKKKVGIETFNRLLEENPRKVIENKDL